MVTRVGKFLGGLDVDVTNVLKVHATENRISLGAADTPAANLLVVGNTYVSTDLVVNQGLGVAGNTAPIVTALSMGTPANVVIRTFAATGVANVIVGDATATSSYNLDVRGTANTGALTASGLAYPTADGTEDYVLSTDGSGALSWVEQTGGASAPDPATSLATNTDCGNFDEETEDAFGIIITTNVTELDCSLYAAETLGTVDMGSVA